MTRRLILASLLTASVLGSSVVHAATITVPSGEPDLAAALALAQPGDTVQLAPGTYYEHDLILPPGITLVGLGDGPESVVLDAGHAGRILLCEGLEQTSTLRNLTFLNGRAEGSNSYDRSGGAILCSNSTLSIVDCNFIMNEADSHGGALRCNNSSPTLVRCTFVGNQAGGGGGAIDASYNSSPLLQDCTLRNNSAEWGGGLSCRADSSPQLEDCHFDGNSAAGDVGLGGAVLADTESRPDFFEVTFSENTARYGGALIALTASETNLTHCTVVSNTSSEAGGGIYLQDASPQITATLINFNSGTGLSTAGAADPVIHCTNIFGNDNGDWVGDIADQTDLTGNLSVDPFFITQERFNEFQYHLAADSPLVLTESECGLLGAKPATNIPLGTDPPPEPETDPDPLPGPVRTDLGDVTAWPNPFNPQTAIHFDLGEPQRVRVEIYNLQGARLRVLADGPLASGPHSLTWDGTDAAGRSLGSGTFLFVVVGQVDRQVRKVTLLK